MVFQIFGGFDFLGFEMFSIFLGGVSQHQTICTYNDDNARNIVHFHIYIYMLAVPLNNGGFSHVYGITDTLLDVPVHQKKT